MKASPKPLAVVGLNHDTAPLVLREKVSFDPQKLVYVHDRLRGVSGIEEALLLSTCNRTEIYASCNNVSDLAAWLAKEKQVPIEDLLPHIYSRTGIDVLAHAARVASGLDSMVLGETQIFGQMKFAYQSSDAAGGLGRVLRGLFQTVFSIAKEVRTNTGIGAHSVSLASVAIKATESVFPELHKQGVLFIGAGEMIQLFCKHFSTRKFGRFFFSNRTYKHSEDLAKLYNGESVSLDKVSKKIPEADIIVSCTGSQVPILGKRVFEEALNFRKHKPILVFDLAVPRDVDVLANTLDDVFVFTVDDLGRLVQDGLSVRQSAIQDADLIISRRLDEYEDLIETDGSINVIKKFREYGKITIHRELEKSLAALKRGEDSEQVLRTFASSVERKFLDRPSRAINNTRAEERKNISDALAHLFNLDDLI